MAVSISGVGGVSFHSIDRIEVRSCAGKAVKNIIVYLSNGVVTDGQDGAVAEGVLVKMGAGKKGGRVDMSVKGFRGPILVNSGGYCNRADLVDVVGKATDPFNKTLVLAAATDAHIKPQR